MDDSFPPPHSAEDPVLDDDVMFESSDQAQENCPTDLELENQITTLCATIAATEYQFLRLLAEYDQRGAWAAEGTRSCAHWLNWRCGINLGAAREKVRVAHALTLLPKISETFSKGHVSYSKVRAMTRIATPELEEDLRVARPANFCGFSVSDCVRSKALLRSHSCSTSSKSNTVCGRRQPRPKGAPEPLQCCVAALGNGTTIPASCALP